MQKPPNNQIGQTGHAQDPFIVANTLNSLITERNPIQVLVGDISHMISVLMNLKKTRQLAQLRIDQLQEQVTKVENSMATVNPQTTGTRLNKLR